MFPATFKTEKGMFGVTLESPLSVKFTCANEMWSFRITPLRILMIALAVAAVGIMLYRFIFGLQPVSNLNDDWPWGLWIGFDVLAGVALAGGGYGTALLVYVLGIKKLNPFIRATALTSLIGYILVLAGLFNEIGRWWQFWRPFVTWGHASPLFEVFWCISMYTLVQVAELGEIVTEKIFKFLHKLFKFVLPVLIVLGIMIPTMHQSTLGALYLLMDGRLDPLWWTPIIFALFFVSSLMVGPAMAMLESVITYSAYGHKPKIEVMRLLARIGGGVMVIYLAIKLGDLYYRGQFGALFAGSFESYAMLAELGLVILPILIVFSPLANHYAGLVIFGALGASGVFLNRMNVVVTGMWADAGSVYYPAVTEVLVSVGLVCGGILVYLFLCENFNILNPPEE
ncbi:Ni/Fe-hydrogenase cytochrome b subunit [Planctomycetales bacterium]|nr:Ni/Fe-hydrogenase cytochrome b subunit [Planctomycetales bacterium]